MDDGDAPHTETARWLLLIHQLPPKPAYLRVKIWRRLQALGAVTVKNSVYVLPASESAQEDCEWLLKEISAGGGEGLICEARLVDGLSDDDVRGLFNAARTHDYQEISKDARALAAALEGSGTTSSDTDARSKLARLRAELSRVAAIDFFGADGRETTEGLVAGLDAQLREASAMEEQAKTTGAAPLDALKARVWVTRKAVHIDRIACAWLILRFIDPDARFKFVAAQGYEPKEGELRFDMYEGEFTHEGDRCTFEVLRTRAELADPALQAIGEIVHDIDLKDAKFGREESAGIACVVDGIAASTKDDARRLQRGATILDDLYEVFRSKPR
jgi:hypothetical protein